SVACRALGSDELDGSPLLTAVASAGVARACLCSCRIARLSHVPANCFPRWPAGKNQRVAGAAGAPPAACYNSNVKILLMRQRIAVSASTWQSIKGAANHSPLNAAGHLKRNSL